MGPSEIAATPRFSIHGNLWAILSVGIASRTYYSLGDAYLKTAKYNILYGAMTEDGSPKKHNACHAAWQDAQSAIQLALERLREDPATARLMIQAVETTVIKNTLG